jgi:archaeosine-15-forming tRNA-guanine transglycosylase
VIAGKGGRFCCVSLADGREVFTYDTGGTVRYYWHEGNVLVPDRKGDVLLLSSKDGAVLNRIALRKPKLTATWHMLVRDGKLYLAASEARTPFALRAVCADL